MLKKLNGNITKSLFYLKNNFLNILFKTCVITTLSILIYLVCILKQTDSARSSEYIDAYPIEHSQKLMLTEIPMSVGRPPSTTEAMTTYANFIPQMDDYVDDTHTFFPLQEQTTTPMNSDQTTTPCHELETTADTSMDTSPKPTLPSKRSLSVVELVMWETTTESLKKETTTFEPVEQNVEPQNEEEEEVFTTPMTYTTTELPHVNDDEISDINATSSTPRSDVTESDDLFMDFLPVEEDDSQIHSPEDTSFELKDSLEAAESIFLKEDNELGILEPPMLENDSPNSSEIPVEAHTSHLEEDIEPSREVFKYGTFNKESTGNQLFSLELPPLLSPTHLFNLFDMDHLPAQSNIKPRWKPKAKVAPVSSGRPAKSRKSRTSRKRHVNSIRPAEDLKNGSNDFQHQFEGLDTFLNMKLKDSMGFFQRLFSNFQQ